MRNSGNLPYGKRLRGGQVEDDPEQQAAIKIMQGMRAGGATWAAIAAALNERDVPPARPWAKQWHPATVKDILKREHRE